VRKDAPYFVRLYNLTEIRDLLNRAGLTLCSVYENWDGKPFASTSFRMIMLARKEITATVLVNYKGGEL